MWGTPTLFPDEPKIKPMFISNGLNLRFLSVRVRNENLPETLAFLEKTWKRFLPDFPFEYAFTDESLNMMYRDDRKVGQLVGAFALLAIGVACLGLFGLAAFTAEQRTKEIGVRKVLGASVRSIVLLLTKEVAQLVLIANALAWPVAYVLANDWLQNFAYRVDLSWWVFALGGVIALLIALGTVAYQALRAATANPIAALRYE
jgi:putative ABC transport system permease protein